jgi:hypothetical protein
MSNDAIPPLPPLPQRTCYWRIGACSLDRTLTGGISDTGLGNRDDRASYRLFCVPSLDAFPPRTGFGATSWAAPVTLERANARGHNRGYLCQLWGPA